MGQSRIFAATVALFLLPAGVGVVAVHASPTCDRFVRTYVTVPVRNHVSKATAAAWAKWRVGHPNWKPNPHVHRPKYIMTRKEAMHKVDFACQVPVEPKVLTALFTPDAVTPPAPMIDLPPMETSEITLPPSAPPEVAELEQQPTAADETPGLFIPPLLPPPWGGFVTQTQVTTTGGGGTGTVTPPPVIAPTPEPPTFLMVGLGAAAFGLWKRRPRELRAA